MWKRKLFKNDIAISNVSIQTIASISIVIVLVLTAASVMSHDVATSESSIRLASNAEDVANDVMNTLMESGYAASDGEDWHKANSENVYPGAAKSDYREMTSILPSNEDGGESEIVKPADPPSQDDKYDVTFIVRDDKDKSLLSGAMVSFNGEDKETVLGKAEFNDISINTYSWQVECEGYEPKNDLILVNKDMTITVYLDPLDDYKPPEDDTYSITFIVYISDTILDYFDDADDIEGEGFAGDYNENEDTFSPFEGASVYLAFFNASEESFDGDGDLDESCDGGSYTQNGDSMTTDKDGMAVYQDLNPGNYIWGVTIIASSSEGDIYYGYLAETGAVILYNNNKTIEVFLSIENYYDGDGDDSGGGGSQPPPCPVCTPQCDLVYCTWMAPYQEPWPNCQCYYAPPNPVGGCIGEETCNPSTCECTSGGGGDNDSEGDTNININVEEMFGKPI